MARIDETTKISWNIHNKGMSRIQDRNFLADLRMREPKSINMDFCFNVSTTFPYSRGIIAICQVSWKYIFSFASYKSLHNEHMLKTNKKIRSEKKKAASNTHYNFWTTQLTLKPIELCYNVIHAKQFFSFIVLETIRNKSSSNLKLDHCRNFLLLLLLLMSPIWRDSKLNHRNAYSSTSDTLMIRDPEFLGVEEHNTLINRL